MENDGEGMTALSSQMVSAACLDDSLSDPSFPNKLA